MKLAAIAAMSENRVIGRDGGLPWHLPGDLRHFMRTTLGRVCVMGRATFESMDGPLPRRPNLVVTRDEGWSSPGVLVAHSIEDGLELAAETAGAESAADIERCPVICGGSGLYEATLDRVDRLILTVVHADIDGDTRFPEVDWSAWREVESVRHESDERHAFAFTIKTFDRSEPGREA